MKLNARKVAAILFMVLMVGTLGAYAVSQAGQLGLLGSQNQKVTLPSTNILDSELTTDQQQLALSQGFTIIKYTYPATCAQCLTIENQLESVASQPSSAVFLERIISQSQNGSSLVFTGPQNSAVYTNPTTDNIIDGMCATFYNPPSSCILRSVNTNGSSTASTLPTSTTTQAIMPATTTSALPTNST